LEGKIDLAQGHWKSAELMGKEAHHWPLVNSALLWQGKVALWQGDLQMAAKLLNKNLDHRIRRRDRVDLAYPLEANASLAFQQMAFEKAARLFGAADRHFSLLKNTLLSIEKQRLELELASLKTKLGIDRFHQYFQDGTGLTTSEINQLLNSG
jgi:tetratricopeptide (TPR) repeat protein